MSKKLNPTIPVPFPATIVIDTREQSPFTFEGIRSDACDGGGPLVVGFARSTLASGDYSVVGLEEVVGVERKSLADLYSTIGQHRERFERELARLNEFRFAAVVVEADWRNILGAWPPRIRQLIDDLRCLKWDWSSERDALALRLFEYIDELCQGPPKHSKLKPKTPWRSIRTWQQRYTRVHWNLMPDRRHAEIMTLRILEQAWKDAKALSEAGSSPLASAGVGESSTIPTASLELLRLHSQYKIEPNNLEKRLIGQRIVDQSVALARVCLRTAGVVGDDMDYEF